MNKFVKGAKNLAFALSFVTVAACGNVKKAELEAGLQNLEKKITDTLEGGAKDGTNNKDQGYARIDYVDGEIKKEKEILEGKIAVLKKETVSLDVLKGASSRNPVGYVKIFGYENLGENCFKGFKISMSNVGANGVCKFKVTKDSVELISEENEARCFTCGDLKTLRICNERGAEVDFSGFSASFEANSNNGVKFGSSMTFNFEKKEELISLIVVLELGVRGEKKFTEFGLGKWVISAGGICGKKLAKGAIEEAKMLVDVLNQYVDGCCYLKDDNSGIGFVGGKGWTKDGSTDIGGEVVVGFAD